jgi:hypothetical protein
MNTWPKPPAVVQRANSSPFIAPSLLRTFHVQFMSSRYPSGTHKRKRHSVRTHSLWGLEAAPGVDRRLRSWPDLACARLLVFLRCLGAGEDAVRPGADFTAAQALLFV